MKNEILSGALAFGLVEKLDAEKLELNDGDKKLVSAMAKNIIERWIERAEGEFGATNKNFDTIYQNENVQALAAIVATIELIQTIGVGKMLPAGYAGLVKART